MTDANVVTKQPTSVPQPEVQSYSLDGHDQPEQSRGSIVQRLRAQYLTRDGLLGSYNWGELCMPRLMPYRLHKDFKLTASAPFYALNEQLPVLLAAICGLQHCLAMLAGLSECGQCLRERAL